MPVLPRPSDRPPHSPLGSIEAWACCATANLGSSAWSGDSRAAFLALAQSEKLSKFGSPSPQSKIHRPQRSFFLDCAGQLLPQGFTHGLKASQRQHRPLSPHDARHPLIDRFGHGNRRRPDCLGKRPLALITLTSRAAERKRRPGAIPQRILRRRGGRTRLTTRAIGAAGHCAVCLIRRRGNPPRNLLPGSARGRSKQ
jgi:hypothetical protein